MPEYTVTTEMGTMILVKARDRREAERIIRADLSNRFNKPAGWFEVIARETTTEDRDWYRAMGGA